MAEEPKKGEPPTPQLAYRVWLETDRVSIRELSRILKARGHPVSHSTLNEWAAKNPKWARQLVEERQAVDPVKIITALKEAEADATAIAPEHLLGVRAQLIGRLYISIKTMELNTIDDWMKALDCCDRIEALIHAERGKKIAEREPMAFPRGATGSLLAKLNPPVTLAKFSKAGA